MKNKKKKSLSNWIGLLYISPWLIGFLLFTLYPILSSIYYSFTDFSIASAPVWIGFKNYIEIFTKDKLAIPSLAITFKYVFLSVPAKLVFALFVAMILNTNMKGGNFYRTVYYCPPFWEEALPLPCCGVFCFAETGL